MSLKKAAEDLLRVADDIEKEAAHITQFVCAKCNHTASLANINEKRSKFAAESGAKITVSEITVNDKVACIACGGEMSYKPTKASEMFYHEIEGEKEASEEEVVDYDS